MPFQRLRIFFFINMRFPRRVSCICSLYVVFPLVSLSQIKEPEKPAFTHSSPYQTAGLEYFQKSVQPYYQNTQVTLKNPTPMGATAEDVINQVNANAPGYQLYGKGSTDAQKNQQASIAYIQRQIQQQSQFSNQQSELLAILNEAHYAESVVGIQHKQTNQSQELTTPYRNALQRLKGMLEGKTPLSIKQAYFEMEKAYGNAFLSQKEYEGIVKESADFIRKWLIQNHYNLSSPGAIHTAIQRFLSDTLTITNSIPDKPNLINKKKHLPFTYDYEDFSGEVDFRNFFLTKTLATGAGQCNSLPAVYLVLSEALGVKAYLSFAPHHALIKYPGDGNLIHNYEPTSNWNITDEWYMEHLFISPEAIKNGIYLDTLNSTQIVANCMLDLAHSYLSKYGLGDGTFIVDCLKESSKYFPEQNNITAHFLLSSCLARKLDKVLRENRIMDLKDISKVPEAENLYNALAQNEDVIRQLGYFEPPKKLYDEMIQQAEFKEKRQNSAKSSGKQRRSLFVNQ